MHLSSPSPVLCLCSQIPGKPTCSIRSCYLSLKAQRPDDEYRFTLTSWDIPPACPSYSHSACNYVIPPPHPPLHIHPHHPASHPYVHAPRNSPSLSLLRFMPVVLRNVFGLKRFLSLVLQHLCLGKCVIVFIWENILSGCVYGKVNCAWVISRCTFLCRFNFFF